MKYQEILNNIERIDENVVIKLFIYKYIDDVFITEPEITAIPNDDINIIIDFIYDFISKCDMLACVYFEIIDSILNVGNYDLNTLKLMIVEDRNKCAQKILDDLDML